MRVCECVCLSYNFCADVCACMRTCVYIQQSVALLNCLLLQHMFCITPYRTPLVCSAILYLTNRILRRTQLITLSTCLSLCRRSGGRTTPHLFILLKLPRPAADVLAHTMETTAASTVTHSHATPQIHTRAFAKASLCAK